MSRLSLSVNLALAWNQAHQELNLGRQGYSYIHMCLCLCVGLDKDSVLFLLSTLSQPFKVGFRWDKRENGLLNWYNLARHQLVSQNCRGYLFCYFCPYLSHFKTEF